MLDPEGKELIGRLVFAKIRDLDISGIGGLELGSVPISSAVCLIAQLEGKPLKEFIVRKEKKDHGIPAKMEGDFVPGSARPCEFGYAFHHFNVNTMYQEGNHMLEYVFFSILNSLVLGMLLFMLSSGLTLIFSMMGVLNFAHASFYMLGAYFGYQITNIIGFWPALIIAPLLVGVLGALVERYGLRTVHKYGHVAELLFTVGLFYIIEESINLIWGRNAVTYPIPAALDFPLFTFLGAEFSL